MLKIVNFAQIIVSVLIIALILLQSKGTGLGTVFGGSEGGIYHTRRGPEKWIFYGTVIAVLAFILLGIISLAIQNTL